LSRIANNSTGRKPLELRGVEAEPRRPLRRPAQAPQLRPCLIQPLSSGEAQVALQLGIARDVIGHQLHREIHPASAQQHAHRLETGIDGVTLPTRDMRRCLADALTQLLLGEPGDQSRLADQLSSGHRADASSPDFLRSSHHLW
jgi:hypothetical protein